MIETHSSLNPLSAGIEIPVDACRGCRKKGASLLKEALNSGKFRTVQIIDRPGKIYETYTP
jgi:hypothetical protein